MRRRLGAKLTEIIGVAGHNDPVLDARVGAPVGVAVAHDGTLLVSDDGNGTIWRISYRGSQGR
jgi:glucose/arabinose dehydrogenase